MTDDGKKEVRPGSARARLEAFERQQKGKKSIFVKFGVVLGLLVVVLVIQMMMSRLEQDRGWFEAPKDAAYMARKGRWDDLAAMLSDDLKIQGVPVAGKESFLRLIRSRGTDGLGAYATAPHDWEAKGDQARVDFWVIWSRGDIAKPAVVPVVTTWLVQALLVKEDDRWQARTLIVRETIAPGGVNLEELMGK